MVPGMVLGMVLGLTISVLTHPVPGTDRPLARSSSVAPRVDTCMSQPDAQSLTAPVCQILDGDHLSVLATTNADGRPQTSVIFVLREGDNILFSTIRGRRKTTNMLRDRRVNLLVHSLPVGATAIPYATISGIVELTEDPDASFHQVMYDRHMGGATPPPEPGAQRLIVRLMPQAVYVPPMYQSVAAE
jgi:PPOX class probable F420-dependent enzyme